MDDKYLEELFALPIKPTLEAVVDGQKFYSSPSLKKAFLKSIGSSGRSSQIYKPIEKLVMKKKRIVPCFLSKNMYRFFKHKMFGSAVDKTSLAFYHMPQKRVFVLVDNAISPVGTGTNDELASTTMHECVHLYAHGMTKKFYRTFKTELDRYYISYFSRVFQLKSKPKLDKMYKFLYTYEYQRGYQMNKNLSKYYKILEKILMPHSQMETITFKKTLTDLIVVVKVYLMSFDAFVRMYRQYMHILGPLDRAYRDAFGKRNRFTTPYQELSAPSEIISVFSEMKPTDSKIKKMFKELA